MDTSDKPIRLEDVRQHPDQFVDDLVHEVLDEEQAAVVRRWCESSDEGGKALREAEARKAVLEAVGELDPDPQLIEQTFSPFSLTLNSGPRHSTSTRFHSPVVPITKSTSAPRPSWTRKRTRRR